MNETAQKKNRLTLVLIVALFGTPILAAFYLNSQWTDWAPETTQNHGQLVKPVLALPDDSVRAVSGELKGLKATGRWVMVHLSENCQSECRQVLVKMRQVHLSTGYNSGKVVQALVVMHSPDSDSMALLEADFPMLSILLDNGNVHALLERSFETASVVFLIDPLGNVMLRYPPGFDPLGLKKDLGRLLRYNKT